MSTSHHRRPIKTQDDPAPRCTSRFSGLRCARKPGHGDWHEAPDPNRPGETIRWGYTRRKR